MTAAARFAVLLAALALLPALARPAASEEGDVLVIDQDYNLVTPAKSDAKDVRQRMYVAKDWMRIEEYKANGKAPTETTIIDMKTQEIVILFQDRGPDQIIHDYKRTVSFAQRRERIEDRIAKLKIDEENLPDGAQKEKWYELNRALLDGKRKFEIQDRKKGPETKELLDVKAEKVTVIDGREKKYAALVAWMHPTVEMPADSAEVLYLLQLIGPKLKEFLDLNKAVFKRVPLEMELDIVGGGTLRTKVNQLSWMKSADCVKLRVIPDVEEKDGQTRAAKHQELTEQPKPETK